MKDMAVEAILTPLIRATENGRVTWDEDPTGGYIARIGDNSVNIYEEDEHSNALRVLDVNGNVVDWTRAYTEQMASDLERLFTLARRQTRNVDGVIEDILHHLEAESPNH